MMADQTDRVARQDAREVTTPPPAQPTSATGLDMREGMTAQDWTHALSVITHDIKNPLASLKLNAQMLARFIERGKMPSETSAQLLAQAVDRLDDIMSEIGALVRAEAVRPAPKLERVDLAPLLSALAAEARERFQRPVTVRAQATPPAMADVEGLRDALWRALTNAATYTPVEASITLTLRQVGARARIETRDAGPGFAEVDLERLFVPFYHGASRAYTGQPVGLGLGLAVARALIRRQGGEMGVDAPPTPDMVDAADTSPEESPRGAVVWITLPLAETRAGH